jgi:hypothetical protein
VAQRFSAAKCRDPQGRSPTDLAPVDCRDGGRAGHLWAGVKLYELREDVQESPGIDDADAVVLLATMACDRTISNAASRMKRAVICPGGPAGLTAALT